MKARKPRKPTRAAQRPPQRAARAGKPRGQRSKVPSRARRERATRRRVPAGLERERRTLIEDPEAPTEAPVIAETAHPGDRHERRRVGQGLTGGDLDANWEHAYSSGEETPGGDNPTPDQDRVDDIGRALGVSYNDEEELIGSDKIIQRDRHRWELDPASAEDYPERSEASEAEDTEEQKLKTED